MSSAGLKRSRGQDTTIVGRPEKRNKGLLEDDSSEESDFLDMSGGVTVKHKQSRSDTGSFKVNEEYARRFEHNQRRAEIHRCKCALCYTTFCVLTNTSGGEIWQWRGKS